MLLESCSSAVVYDKNVWLFIYVKETKFVFGQKQQTFLKQVTTIQLVFYVLCFAINTSPKLYTDIKGISLKLLQICTSNEF